MTIQFCGAAREVTGSAHLITLIDGKKILLECGLYQGHDEEMDDFNSNWYFDPKELHAVILSHAHIDHSGRLPKLVKDGFRGTIYCTHATRSLCSIMLLDSAKIQEWDAEYFNKRQRKKSKDDRKPFRSPLYTGKDVRQTMRQFASFPYDQQFSIHPDVKVSFQDAGHILGSASLYLEIKEDKDTLKIGFTGDIGRPNRPILRDPQPMPEVDVLLCESTYGDKEHEAPPAETQRFLDIILKTCIQKKGKLIIPAFSIGRTQEIVHMLDRLETAGKLPEKIPVYVDSPLAINATQIFGTHPECYDDDLNEYLLEDYNPFGFNSLHYLRKAEDSKALNTSNEPCIIISSSGMMNAGRVKHHLFHNIDDERNTFLIVGYAVPHTPAGRLRGGADELRVFGVPKKVEADVEIMDSFSAHADRAELVQFLQNQQQSVRQLFLVHGDFDTQQVFRDYLRKEGFGHVDIEIPELGQEFEVS